jgi:hypothetical protein
MISFASSTTRILKRSPFDHDFGEGNVIYHWICTAKIRDLPGKNLKEGRSYVSWLYESVPRCMLDLKGDCREQARQMLMSQTFNACSQGLAILLQEADSML